MKNSAIFGFLLGVYLLSSSCEKDKILFTPNLNCVDTISFSQQILPIIQQNCLGCHSVGNGTGYVFTQHTNISTNANAILGSMRNSGFQLMPQGGPALPDSTIQLIECWIYQGKLDN